MTKEEALERAREARARAARAAAKQREREAQREIKRLSPFFRGEESRQITYINRELLRDDRTEPVDLLLLTRKEILKRASARQIGA